MKNYVFHLTPCVLCHLEVICCSCQQELAETRFFKSILTRVQAYKRVKFGRKKMFLKVVLALQCKCMFQDIFQAMNSGYILHIHID